MDYLHRIRRLKLVVQSQCGNREGNKQRKEMCIVCITNGLCLKCSSWRQQPIQMIFRPLRSDQFYQLLSLFRRCNDEDCNPGIVRRNWCDICTLFSAVGAWPSGSSGFPEIEICPSTTTTAEYSSPCRRLSWTPLLPLNERL